MAGKKGAQSAKDKAAPDATSDEPVMVWAIACKGMAPSEIVGEGVIEAVEALKERGAIVHNGKRGKGAKLVAKEFASTGASAEASA